MNFGEALEVLRADGRVARDGWNGKGQWVELVRPGEDRYPITLPFLAISTVDRHLVPWLASQTDILAEDWVEVV